MTPIQIILCCIISLMALFIINGQIYLRSKRGWMEWLYHDICRWHVPEGEPVTKTPDSLFQYSACRHCRQTIFRFCGGDWMLE